MSLPLRAELAIYHVQVSLSIYDSSHSLLTLRSLVGISGMILADRLLDMPYAREVKQRFQNALEEEFTTQDGTILPIRSELTGFTVSLTFRMLEIHVR